MNGAHDQRTGMMAAIAAFSWWGLTPIYFRALSVVEPLEVILHRIFWAIPVMAAYLLLRDGPGFWRQLMLPLRDLLILFVTGALMGGGWLMYIWAVGNEHILSTSFGYFIAPLVSVLLGFIFLQERLTRTQFIAVIIVASGMFYLGWFMGQPPWIALILASTVGFYALLRKKLDVGPMVGLFWEIVLFAGPTVILVSTILEPEQLRFGQISWTIDLMLAGAGLVTVMPLFWFNVAAKNLPLKKIGVFQYIAPSLSFFLAVVIYSEPFNRGHAIAFASIAIALLLVSSESVFKPRGVQIP